MRRNISLRLVPVVLSFACLFGCGGGEPAGHAEARRGDSGAGQARGQEVTESAQDDFEPYQAPEFADCVFHAELAEGEGDALLDLSTVSQGYVGVSVKADSRVKIKITTDQSGDADYVYDVPLDGTPVFFPLSCGNRRYTFYIGENITESRYARLYETELDVTLEDEFQPFIRPSAYVDYSRDSDCVRKAAELAKGAETALDVVEAVYEFVCDNITYDYDLAGQVVQKSVSVKGYVPDLDRVLTTKKGICFDYAALTAAMLRSQGIPTKMVFGDVSPDDTYHAWNMFYTDQTGWVSVHFEVKTGEWNRLDLTYSASGQDNKFIGDGANYLDMMYY